MEHRVERRFLFFKNYYDVAVWNEPLPDEELSRIERTVREAFSALDQKYKYAVDGAVKIHPRKTSVEVCLSMEDDLKKEIIHDYLGLAEVHTSFHNIDRDFLDKALQPYGKRLEGFSVVDCEQVAPG